MSGDILVRGKMLPRTYDGLTELPGMSQAALAKAAELRSRLEKIEQTPVKVFHFLHAGVYVRTLVIPADQVSIGCVVKRDTVLVISGDVSVWLGENPDNMEQEIRHFEGHVVLSGKAGRQQIFRTFAETTITMTFATDAKTVEEAEREFTDETRLIPAVERQE